MSQWRKMLELKRALKRKEEEYRKAYKDGDNELATELYFELVDIQNEIKDVNRRKTREEDD